MSSSNQLPNKLIREKFWKDSCRVATTADIGATFSLGQFTSAPTVVDGITLAVGDRILVKNQTNGQENGVYAVTSSGVWDRTSDADSARELTGAFVLSVREGTVNADSMWMFTTDVAITINTTPLAFALVFKNGKFTTGSVIFAGSDGNFTEDNANLFWDDTNNRLGIGQNSSLSAKLHIDTTAAGNIGTRVEAFTGQTANLSEWYNATSDLRARITSSGQFSNNFGVTSNEAFGSGALNAGGGTSCTAFGRNALNLLSGGSYHTAFGTYALNTITGGFHNTAFGNRAMQGFTTGNRGTVVGSYSLRNATGSNNTVVGAIAGNTIGAGTNNTLIGAYTGVGSGGNDNVIIGSFASQSLASSRCITIGRNLGATHPSDTIAIGYNALDAITSTSTGNLAIGNYTGKLVTSGTNNVFIGLRAATDLNPSASGWVVVGRSAAGVVGGSVAITSTIAIGAYAAYGCPGSSVAIGEDTLPSGDTSIAIGRLSLANSTSSASNNICIGVSGGATLTAGVRNTIIGNSANVSSSGQNDSISFGYEALSRVDGDFGITPRISRQTFNTLSSTSTNRETAAIVMSAIDNTDATRKYRVILNVYDTAIREGLRLDATGSAAQVGIGGVVSSASHLLNVNGTVELDGLVCSTVTVSSSPHSVLTTTKVLFVDATSGAITLNLPAVASNDGRVYYIKKIDSSSNAVVIDPNGAETIDGASTRSLTVQYESVTIVANSSSSQWFVV